MEGRRNPRELVAHVAEGSVRIIRVRLENGDVHFEIPTTAGIVTGGIVAKLKIEVVRQEPQNDNAARPSDDRQSEKTDG